MNSQFHSFFSNQHNMKKQQQSSLRFYYSINRRKTMGMKLQRNPQIILTKHKIQKITQKQQQVEKQFPKQPRLYSSPLKISKKSSKFLTTIKDTKQLQYNCWTRAENSLQSFLQHYKYIQDNAGSKALRFLTFWHDIFAITVHSSEDGKFMLFQDRVEAVYAVPWFDYINLPITKWRFYRTNLPCDWYWKGAGRVTERYDINTWYQHIRPSARKLGGLILMEDNQQHEYFVGFPIRDVLSTNNKVTNQELYFIRLPHKQEFYELPKC